MDLKAIIPVTLTGCVGGVTVPIKVYADAIFVDNHISGLSIDTITTHPQSQSETYQITGPTVDRVSEFDAAMGTNTLKECQDQAKSWYRYNVKEL